jgi:hypothetical protein
VSSVSLIWYINGRVSIKECFKDFIHAHEKTGSGLASQILRKLLLDGIDIKMQETKAVIEQQIWQVNTVECKQTFFRNTNLPCAYSLNLSGVNATSLKNAVLAFFGILQRLFTFCSSSTSCWEMLMNTLHTYLEGHSETHWSSKASAIKHCIHK